ncbi:hypothetical protein Tco_1046004 [Tanacetum coccineum]
MFWHTARDDTMFTSMRCISRHKDTQVYGTIFPKELINQTMLESNAYNTYYAFASGDKTPKLKYIRKKVDSDTSPKKKPIQATKGTRIKSKVKVSKSDKKKQPKKKPKAKGLAVLSEVALTEAEQLKLATKRSKIQFHSSHISGSGDRVDTQSKVPDKKHLETTGANEGTSTILGVPDVPIYESESEKESWGESEDKDEDNENDSDDLSDEGDDDNNGNDDDDDKQEGDDTNDDNEETDNTKITNADQGASEQQNVSQESGFEQVEEDAHVTLTLVLDTQKADELVQSSSVSSDFTSKLLNLVNPSPVDNECFIDGNLSPSCYVTTSFPSLLDFSSVFRFNDRVTNLENDQSEIKQVAQQEAQDEKNAYIELVDTSIRALIKEESAHADEPSPTVEDSGMQQDQKFVMRDNDEQPVDKEVTKSDWFKKLKRPPTPDPDWSKRQHVDFRPPQTWISQVAHAEEPPILFDELNDTSFDFSAFVINRLTILNLNQEILLKYYQHAYLGTSHWGPKHQRFYRYASNLTSSKDVYSIRRIIAVNRLNIMKKYDYGHLEEIEVRRDDQKLYTLKEGDFKRLRLQDIEDMLLLLVQQKLTNLTINERYDLNVALCMYTRRIVIQRRVEDLQLGVESYQKKLNLTKPDTYRSNLKNKTAYTSYSDPHGIIYVDQYKRKRLMRTDELHKFSDGTLNDVRTALHDIVAGIRMEYLPMRKWSNLDKKRARVMVQDIDKQLYQRRLMRNLEKFVGGRVYRKDLRLLERTI